MSLTTFDHFLISANNGKYDDVVTILDKFPKYLNKVNERRTSALSLAVCLCDANEYDRKTREVEASSKVKICEFLISKGAIITDDVRSSVSCDMPHLKPFLLEIGSLIGVKIIETNFLGGWFMSDFAVKQHNLIKSC